MSARLPATFAKDVAVTGTAVALAADGTMISEAVIKADADNAGTIYVGPSTVTSANGYPLAAGESVSIDAIDKRKTGSQADDQTDLNDWYINGTANDGVRVLYIVR